MVKRRQRRAAGLFRRLVSLKRFPDEGDAIEFALTEAAAAGVEVDPEPSVDLVELRGGDQGWLIVFSRAVGEEQEGG